MPDPQQSKERGDGGRDERPLNGREREALEAAWLRRYEDEEDEEAVSLAEAEGSDAADEFIAGYQAGREAPTELETQLAEECAKVGVPIDLAGLLRHAANNAKLTGALEGLAAREEPPGEYVLISPNGGVIDALKILQDRTIGSLEANARAIDVLVIALSTVICCDCGRVAVESCRESHGLVTLDDLIESYANPREDTERPDPRKALVLLAIVREARLLNETDEYERYDFFGEGLLKSVPVPCAHDEVEADLTEAGVQFIADALHNIVGDTER